MMQVLSYSVESRMPTGRDSTLPETLLRGIYVVQSNTPVELALFDPRGPLDAMEVHDAIDDMYMCARL